MQQNNGIWEWKHKASLTKETGYESVIKSLNIVSVEEFKALDPDKQEALVDIVLQVIRSVNIYPIHYFNDAGISAEIQKCFRADISFLDDTLTEHGREGLILLDFIFPNLHLATAGSNDSMYERFYNNTKLAKCLLRHMKNYKFTSMRTPFFMYGRFFWSTPTNFSPMRARSIYEKFCKTGSVIYDFSSGYGGRMLGALSNLNSNYKYIGCEPNIDTYHNLGRLGQYIEKESKRTGSYELYNACSEDLRLPTESVDFAFSCPPYFGIEKYSDEDSQSINKYPTYETWLVGYVKRTLLNIKEALKPNGLLSYMIAGNVWYRNKQYPLAADWQQIAEGCGFILIKKYSVKTMSRKTGADIEALYVFKKEII